MQRRITKQGRAWASATLEDLDGAVEVLFFPNTYELVGQYLAEFMGWGQATFENWQSEFLQLLTFVVLTTYLIHRGSHESKDSDEAMQAQLDRIERRVAALGAAAAPAESGVASLPNGVAAPAGRG